MKSRVLGGTFMGAWGIDSFENDCAGDWVSDLAYEDDGLELIIATLSEAADNIEGYLEEPVGAEALAAAEVVAAMFGKPCKGLPVEVSDWLAQNVRRDDNLKKMALKAVEVVKTKSELMELWKESEEFNLWISSVEELSSRLK